VPEEQRQHFQQWLNGVINNAIQANNAQNNQRNNNAEERPIVVNAPNPNVPIPKFNPKKTTANHFLDDVETYFRAQHHAENRWVNLIPTILQNENKQWYDLVKNEIETWANFRQLFINKFDSPAVQQERLRNLYTRRQNATEPLETYVYDMVTLAAQVNPAEIMQTRVTRARDGLIPRLRLALQSQVFDTADDLINAGKLCLKTLRDQDNFKQGLPPATKAEADQQAKPSQPSTSTQNTERSNTNTTQPRQYYNSNYRGNFNQRGNFNGRQQNQRYNGYRSNNNYNNNNNSYQGSNFNPNSDNRPNAERQPDQRQNSSRGGHSSSSSRQPTQQPNNTQQNVKCHKCLHFGHLARQCPSKQGVMMPLTGEDDLNTWSFPQPEDQAPEAQPTNYSHDQHLNYQGREANRTSASSCQH